MGMKIRKFLLFSFFVLITSSVFSISYTWNGSVSTAWNNQNNWTPNTGTPSATDDIIIVSTARTPVFDNSTTGCTNFTLTSGTIDLGGFTFTVSGNLTCTAGTIQNGIFTVSGATTATFGNGPVTMNCIANITSAAVTLRNTTFQNTTTITKTGASNDAGYGQNTFNGTTTITNNGTGYWLSTNNVADVYNGNVTFTSTSGRIIPVQNGTNTQFNGNITINCTSSTGSVEIGNNTGTTTFSAATSISVGASGFTDGTLELNRITQAAAGATQTILLTGASNILIHGNSSFTGTLDITAPDIYCQGATFNGPVTFTKTGSTNCHNNGSQNTFNSTLTINQQGTGYLMFSYNSADVFNDNITVTSTNSGGIAFGFTSGTGTPVLAAGKTISVGAAGFSAGFLRLASFTYNAGVPLNLTFTGTAYLVINNSPSTSIFNDAVNITAPDIYVRGGTFNGAATFTKTGGTTNHNNGAQNIFNSTCTINQQSNANYFMLGYSSNDLFNDNIIVTSSGSGGIYLGYSSTACSPTLAAGKTISIGAGGFSAGFLYLGTFTQNGNAAMNLAMTGTAYFQVARSSVIGGDLTITAPGILLDNTTFAGTVTANKTGSSTNNCAGGNTFTGLATITNSGSGIFRFANSSGDNFMTHVNATNSGTGSLELAYNSAGNIFAGNVTLTNTSSGTSNLLTITSQNNSTASIAGNLSCTNTGAGTDNTITFSNGTGANLSIGGGATLINSSTGTGNNYLYFGNNGSVSVTNGITLTNGGSGTNCRTFFAHAATSTVTIGGAVDLTNSSSATGLNDIYISHNGSCSIAGNLTYSSSASGANSNFYIGQNNTASSLTVGGNLNITNSGSCTSSNTCYIAGLGDVTIGGTTNIVNAASNGSSIVALCEGNAASSITFSNNVTLTNSSTTATGSAYIRIMDGAVAFNGNLVVNNSATTSSANNGVYLAWQQSSAGNATLANTKTITIGSGFSVGTLQLLKFTQTGNTAQSLALTGTASLIVGSGSAFGGNVTFSSPGLLLNGCTYSGTTSFTKTGSGTNNSSGGNTFTGICTILNNGSGIIRLANTTADNFVTHVTATNSGSGSIDLAYNSAGNIFGGNVALTNTANGANNTVSIATSNNATAAITGDLTISNTGSGTDNPIYLANGTSSSLTIGGNLSITHAATGTGNQYCYIANNGSCSVSGTATISNSCSGTNSAVYIAYNIAASSFTCGSTFSISNAGTATNNNVYFANNGSATLNGAATFINSGTGTTCYTRLAETAATSSVTINGTCTLTNTSTATDAMIRVHTGSAFFNDNLIVNNTATGSATWNGIYVGSAATGNATLAATKTITVGATGFTKGVLQLYNFTQIGNTAQSLALTGTARLLIGAATQPSSFGGDLTFSCSGGLATITNSTLQRSVTGTATSVTTNTSNYNSTTGTTSLTQTGATNTTSNGGNTFTGITTFTNSGSAQWYFGNTTADNFLSNVTANNSGSGSLSLGHNSANNAFGGDLTMNNTASGAANVMYLANGANSTATVSGNLTVNNSPTGTGSADMYLANSGTLTVTGTTSVTNSGTGTHNRIFICESTNASTATFNGNFSYSSSSTATTDVYCRVLRGTVNFNGNITLVHTTSSPSGTNGFYIGWSAYNGNASLANTKTISIGGGGFSAGVLQLYNFTQTGNTAQNITLTGTARLLLGAAGLPCTFNGDLTFSCSGGLATIINSTFQRSVTGTATSLTTNTSSYNGTAGTTSLTQTGAANTTSSGGNTFTGVTTLTNNGSAQWIFANTTADAFVNNVMANNSGTGSMYLANGSSSNTFGADLTMNNTASGAANVMYLVNGASATATINGNLTLNNSATGTGTADMYISNTGTLTVTGTTSISNNSNGTHSRIFLCEGANASSITFNNNVTYACASAATTDAYIRVLRGTVNFNGNLTISHAPSSNPSGTQGFYTGWATYNGNATLANSKTISIGAGGFSKGVLRLYKFTQTGTTAQTISLTGTASLVIGTVAEPAIFNGGLTYSVAANSATITGSTFAAVTGTATSNIITSNTFGGAVALTKNGTANDDANGSNTYNGPASFTTTNTGRWRLGTSADDYNSSATFVQSGAGLLQPAYSASSTFAGDISTTGTSTAITFGAAANGRVIIDGSADVSFTGASAQKPVVTRLTMNKTTIGNKITLAVPVDVNTDLTLTNGIIVTDATNILTLTDESVTVTNTGTSSTSYIEGPMNYITNSNTANSTLFFPLGGGTYSSPILLTYTHSSVASVTYTARNYFSSAVALGFTLPGTLTLVSDNRYYKIDRSAVANLTSANLTIYYDVIDRVSDYTNLRIAKSTNNTSPWIDIGGTATANGTGSIQSGAFSSFSYFSLANRSGGTNILPIQLLSFTAELYSPKQVDLNWTTEGEINNDYFTVERSADGTTFKALSTIKSIGTTSQKHEYHSIDMEPLTGISYYRLKQTDYNGKYTYSHIVPIDNSDVDENIVVFPNPVLPGDVVNILIHSNKEKSSLVVVTDINGKEIFSKIFVINKGENVITAIEREKKLAPGLYSITYTSDERIQNRKLLIK